MTATRAKPFQFSLRRLLLLGVLFAMYLGLSVPGSNAPMESSLLGWPIQCARESDWTGVSVAVVIGAAISSFILHPTTVTATLSILGMLLWIAIGWLISTASC